LNALLISDLHLTANPRDEYRWKLFDWLCEVMPKHSVRYLYILGDLTDAKDFHGAKLVNRIVDSLLKVYRATQCLGIYILRGNHDGVDPTCAYFRFLGQFPAIKFIDTPWMETMSGLEVLLLPHTTDPGRWNIDDIAAANLIMMHATVTGSVAENGQQLTGINPGFLRAGHMAKIYSGDVHIPQMVGRIEYVGAPYPIKFGDDFTGRAVLLENFRKAFDIYPPTIGRHYMTVTADGVMQFSGDGCGYAKGDQVKARIRLAPHEALEWQGLKDKIIGFCIKENLELCGVELDRIAPAPGRKVLVRKGAAKAQNIDQVLDAYCAKNKISDEVKTFGSNLLHGL
jgi:UDP-2,3-diacylglucosamine pyrophosphatase LpxH